MNTTTPHDQPKNASAILAACHLLLTPDQVTEVRVLNTRYQTVSGYFDNHAALAADVDQWNGKAPAVYVTLNPVNPALLARASNRLVTYAKQTTSDPDVSQRRWLPFDFDPV